MINSTGFILTVKEGERLIENSSHDFNANKTVYDILSNFLEPRDGFGQFRLEFIITLDASKIQWEQNQ